MTVLDASALLAWLQGEPGTGRVDEALRQGATIHTVNWAEVLTKLASRGARPADVTRQLSERGVLGQLLTVDAGQLQDAEVVAELYAVTRVAGLSLGDRYCLALGQRLSVPVLTTDRAWAALALTVTVELAR
ncbi:type II toxin-antitoxin system VapC family toxin [Deinococcus koreensis]|uniref:VapC toxin family PIN domain ribonuclease n=1 Tax=Deinococcus koreensis TaxID=2054903 RepID=A0A2K3URR7_9DEIO|nr:type II toxin-antitoxin system VapC family toxin [Deinococcus koreensis]PNY79242.1 VapC toxin family PIN domain ribonuclease [Deinococcus koreensis]